MITSSDRVLAGYREVARAMLRNLMLEQKLPPGHPLVASYNFHLEMATAQAEYEKVADSLKTKELREAYFTGCPLNYFTSNCDTASSLDEDWEVSP